MFQRLPSPRRFALRWLLPATLLGVLSACATQVPPAERSAPVLTSATPEQMVAAIDAAAGDGEAELAIQPLRDPKVEDLRETAQRLQRQGHYADAAKALDAALAIVPDDPALLQERAEVALLLKDDQQAESLARRAFELGSKVGPLCRRHWATIEQLRLLAGDADGTAAARAQVGQCTVAGVDRF